MRRAPGACCGSKAAAIGTASLVKGRYKMAGGKVRAPLASLPAVVVRASNSYQVCTCAKAALARRSLQLAHLASSYHAATLVMSGLVRRQGQLPPGGARLPGAAPAARCVRDVCVQLRRVAVGRCGAVRCSCGCGCGCGCTRHMGASLAHARACTPEACACGLGLTPGSRVGVRGCGPQGLQAFLVSGVGGAAIAVC